MMNVSHSSFAQRMIRHLVPNVGTIILLALFLWAQAAGAFPISAPQGPTDTRISYQGRLTGVDDQPLAGSYDMAFALYTAQTGGTPFWSETHTGVAVQDGLFNVLLGSVVALPSPLPAGNLYLGMTVGGEEIAPRQLLSSSYHALESNLAAGVADGVVGTAQLAEGAVTAAKLADGAVGSAQVADNALTAADLAPASVTASELASSAVDSSKIVDASIAAVDLAPDSVGASQISSGAVGSSELASSAVNSSKIVDGSIAAMDLAPDSVGASHIATGAVGTSEVADNSLAAADLAPDSVGASEIGANAVGSSELSDNSVTSNKIQNGAVTQAKAPSLVAGPTSNTRVAHGRSVATRVTGSEGAVSISLTPYGFTQTPTVLCSVAGFRGFDWNCHVEYEDTSGFSIWVRHLDGLTSWTTVPVRWIAIGN